MDAERCPVCLRDYPADRITYECDTCGVSTCDECAVGHSGSHSPGQHAVPLCVLEDEER